jgi:hypothetical protein
MRPGACESGTGWDDESEDCEGQVDERDWAIARLIELRRLQREIRGQAEESDAETSQSQDTSVNVYVKEQGSLWIWREG